jgi:spore coat protein E
MYKEIVTKAVIGKGKKFFHNSYSIEAPNYPTTVLGCWVINHKFKGYKTGEKIGVDGSFDVNIWYSYEKDSKTSVINKKIEYNDLFNVKMKEEADLSNDTDIIVRTLKQPTCSKVEIVDGKINFEIEKELGVEIVGDVKVKISYDEDEDPWQVMEESKDEMIEKEIDKQVDENYLDNKN